VHADANAAVLVGVDLLVGRTDDDRGVQAVDPRARSRTLRTIGNVERLALERVGVVRTARRRRGAELDLRAVTLMDHGGDQNLDHLARA